jgi:hypothetical protein
MRAFAWGGLALLMVAGPASAHHSFAMFDQTREITLAGTVSEFQWTNPHSWLELDVPTLGQPGASTHWSLESGSVHTLTRLGWKSKTVKAGDKVIVTVNPMKDGSHGGALQSVTLPDGRKINGGGR